jgi:tol-pal system protein YbgF
MKQRALILLGLCFVAGPAFAGLFNDDEARLQIQKLGISLDDSVKRQAEINSQLDETNKLQAETNKLQAETIKQQTRTMLDLQSQIENLNTELRILRGQNEELVHNLRDAEKRQKDFYIDLDTRVRHFESVELSSPTAQSSATATGLAPAQLAPSEKTQKADDSSVATPSNEPVSAESRAFDAAHGMFIAGKLQNAIEVFQEFIKKFPDSVNIASAQYEMGAAYFLLNDYQNAIASYQVLQSRFAFNPKTPEAMLGIADCQQALKDAAGAKKTLKLLIAKYPGSEIVGDAQKRLEKIK